MSFNGIRTFDGNLRKLMALPEFKRMSTSERWQLGYCLLMSKFGLAIGRAPQPLPENQDER